jgi:hypothetical protein
VTCWSQTLTSITFFCAQQNPLLKIAGIFKTRNVAGCDTRGFWFDPSHICQPGVRVLHCWRCARTYVFIQVYLTTVNTQIWTPSVQPVPSSCFQSPADVYAATVCSTDRFRVETAQAPWDGFNGLGDWFQVVSLSCISYHLARLHRGDRRFTPILFMVEGYVSISKGCSTRCAATISARVRRLQYFLQGHLRQYVEVFQQCDLHVCSGFQIGGGSCWSQIWGPMSDGIKSCDIDLWTVFQNYLFLIASHHSRVWSYDSGATLTCASLSEKAFALCQLRTPRVNLASGLTGTAHQTPLVTAHPSSRPCPKNASVKTP